MSGPYGPQQGGPGQFGGPNQGGGGPWGGPGPGGPGPGGPVQGGPGPAGFGPGPANGPGYGGAGYGQGGPGSGGPGPGGPAQSGQWTPPKAPKPPKAPSAPLDIGKLAPLVIGGLGVVNLIVSFFTEAKYTSGGQTTGQGSVWTFTGWAPALLLAAAILSVGPYLPGKTRQPLAVLALSAAGGLGALLCWLTVGTRAGGQSDLTVSGGIGLILVTIFGIIQAIAAGVVLFLGEPSGASTSKPSAAATAFGAAAPGVPGGRPASSEAGQAPGGQFGPPAARPSSFEGGYGGPPPAGSGFGGQPDAYGSHADSPPADPYLGYGAPSPQSAGYPAAEPPPYGGYSGGPNTGSTPAADPSQYGRFAPPATGSGPAVGGPRPQDEGPNPDVTQQVRF